MNEKYVYEVVLNDYGEVKLTIDAMMKKRKINTYKLSKLTGINWGVLQRYINNELYRVDLDLLARICYVLDCNLKDVMTYVYIDENIQEKMKIKIGIK